MPCYDCAWDRKLHKVPWLSRDLMASGSACPTTGRLDGPLLFDVFDKHANMQQTVHGTGCQPRGWLAR